MYEKLDKLRVEVERCKRKLEDAKTKLKEAEIKLQEAENSQILADVGAMKLTPEQLATFLKMISSKDNRPDLIFESMLNDESMEKGREVDDTDED